MAIFPFIFLKRKRLKYDKYLINHEKIHLRQQLELLIIPFFLVYVLEFAFRFMWLRKWKKAYVNLSFEREASKNENDLNYLKSRPFWNFVNYM